MEQSGRGAALTTFAVLFAILAVSNFLKPFHFDPHGGLVFFGIKTTGLTNTILSVAWGIFLVVFAAGIWQLRRWSLPIAIAYAPYVVLNGVLFTVRNASASNQPGPAVAILSGAVGIGVPVTTAILLWRRRAQLT